MFRIASTVFASCPLPVSLPGPGGEKRDRFALGLVSPTVSLRSAGTGSGGSPTEVSGAFAGWIGSRYQVFSDRTGFRQARLRPCGRSGGTEIRFRVERLEKNLPIGEYMCYFCARKNI